MAVLTGSNKQASTQKEWERTLFSATSAQFPKLPISGLLFAVLGVFLLLFLSLVASAFASVDWVVSRGGSVICVVVVVVFSTSFGVVRLFVGYLRV